MLHRQDRGLDREVSVGTMRVLGSRSANKSAPPGVSGPAGGTALPSGPVPARSQSASQSASARAGASSLAELGDGFNLSAEKLEASDVVAALRSTTSERAPSPLGPSIPQWGTGTVPARASRGRAKQLWKFAEQRYVLVFTRHCYYQYCMVYSIQTGGRKGVVYCPIIVD